MKMKWQDLKQGEANKKLVKTKPARVESKFPNNISHNWFRFDSDERFLLIKGYVRINRDAKLCHLA